MTEDTVWLSASGRTLITTALVINFIYLSKISNDLLALKRIWNFFENVLCSNRTIRADLSSRSKNVSAFF